MTKLAVDVTQHDIDEAHRSAIGAGPISNAILRNYANITNVRIGLWDAKWDVATVTDGKVEQIESSWEATVPQVARDNLLLFDHGRPVSPFAFELEAKQVTTDKTKVKFRLFETVPRYEKQEERVYNRETNTWDRV